MQTINMQVILTAGFALALVLMAIPLVLAEENSSNELVVISTYNGTDSNDSNQVLDSETMIEINDDLNESVSGFDVSMAKVGLWFTFNQEKKAEKELKLARLELIRARIFANNNNTVAMEKALEEHNRIIERIQTRMESLDGKSTKEGSQESAKGLIAIEKAIQVHEARIQKLNELLAGNTNFSEEQIAKIQEKIDKAENVTAKLKELELAKKEKIKTKLMAVANMTEEEAQNEIESLENVQNLSVVKELIAKKRLSEAEKRLEDLNGKVSEAETEGKNMTNAVVRIVELEQAIEEAKVLIQEGRYDEALNKLKPSEGSKKADKEVREQNREQSKEKKEPPKEGNNTARKQAMEVNKQARVKAIKERILNKSSFKPSKNGEDTSFLEHPDGQD